MHKERLRSQFSLGKLLQGACGPLSGLVTPRIQNASLGFRSRRARELLSLSLRSMGTSLTTFCGFRFYWQSLEHHPKTPTPPSSKSISPGQFDFSQGYYSPLSGRMIPKWMRWGHLVTQFKSNDFAEMWSICEEGSDLRLIDLCMTQL